MTKEISYLSLRADAVSVAIQKNIKHSIMSIINKLTYSVIPGQAGIQTIFFHCEEEA
jgi:hypothetical protein